jgi:carbon monoxide dehydrogenase subunit G
MNLNGTFTFNGPRDVVWELLQDPVVLAKALPGTERLALTGADQYEGVMKVNVGPVTAAKFDINVALKDKVPPERMSLQIEGKGPVGFTRGTAAIALDAQADGTTILQYTSDVQVGGRIASVGQRLIESVSKMMMRQALDALQRELGARLAASPANPTDAPRP